MTCHMGEDRGKATKKKYHEHKAREEVSLRGKSFYCGQVVPCLRGKFTGQEFLLWPSCSMFCGQEFYIVGKGVSCFCGQESYDMTELKNATF